MSQYPGPRLPIGLATSIFTGGGTLMGGTQVWRIGTDGVLMPFAGQGSGFVSPGDRMPAVLAGSLYADAIAVDGGGNVFLAGGRNGFAMTSLYRVTPDGMIAIYYVTPTNWTAIDSLSTDAAGNLYVLAETPAPLVVKIAPDRGKTGPYRTPPGWLSIPKPRSNLANLYE